MEYNNINDMHQFEARQTETSKLDLLTHLKTLNANHSADNQPKTETVKPKSALAKQMEGLSFEEQKEMLNKMASSGSSGRPSEYVGKRYSLDDLKKMDLSVVESVKLLINEAATSPRMDMKSISFMVEDLEQSKIEKAPVKPVSKKSTHKNLTAA